MTDDELNALSAMSIFPEKQIHIGVNKLVWIKDYYPPEVTPRTAPWKPMTDGNQALMLVEILKLGIFPQSMTQLHDPWCVRHLGGVEAHGKDLCRAIVECAAKVSTPIKSDVI